MFIKKCEQCGRDREFKNKNSMLNTKAIICGSCSKKNRNMSGENNPFYGKKHSEDTKKKMSDNHADFTGDKNPFKNSLTDEKRIELSNRVQEFWDSKNIEYRKKFGSKISKSLSRAKTTSNKNHKHGHLLCSNGKEFFYRSNWELKILEFLNQLYDTKKIVDFSLESYCIDYIHDGYEYSLRIDFEIILLNKKILLECKPVGLRDIGRNPIKIKAYQEYCNKNNIQFILYDNKDASSIEEFWEIIK